MSGILRTKISAVRSKLTMVSSATGVAAAVGLLPLLLAVEMLLDFYIELPWTFRAAILGVYLLAAALLLVRYVVVPVSFGPDDDSVALMMERFEPAFRSRLIASVQLARPKAIPAGAAVSLVRAMIQETEIMARPVDFTQLVRASTLLKTTLATLLIMLLCGVGYVSGGQVSSELFKRAVLGTNDVPRKTRVSIQDGDKKIPRGDAVTLVASAEGVIPPVGKAELRFDSGQVQEVDVVPAADGKTRFTCTINNVQDSFSYIVRLNDGHSSRHRITAIARPAIASLKCVQTYPKYTRRSPVPRMAGDLSILAGSTLLVEATASKDIASGEIHLAGVNAPAIAMARSPLNPRVLSGSFKVAAEGLQGFHVHMVDGEGIDSRDETVYHIDVVPDAPPQVHMTWPDRERELVTQRARILMAFEATDDYGIGKVILHYRVDKLEANKEHTRDLEIGDGNPTSLRRRYEFNLGELTPLAPEGAIVEYWIEVQDLNTETAKDGVGKGFTDHFTAEVVSREKLDEDLKNRWNEYLTRIDMMSKDQETLSDKLGTMILSKPSTRP